MDAYCTPRKKGFIELIQYHKSNFRRLNSLFFLPAPPLTAIRIHVRSPESTLANLPEYSVSEIAGAIKRTVEDRFPFVRIRGEVSNLKFHSSGHVYFDLKDDKACLNAVIWRPPPSACARSRSRASR